MKHVVISTEFGTEEFRAHLSHYGNVKDEQELMDEGGGVEKIVAFVELDCSYPSIRAIESILDLESDGAVGPSRAMDLFRKMFVAGRSSAKQLM